MNDDELKKLWRQQELASPSQTSDTEIVARMKKKMRKFDRTLFWRDGRELAACLFVGVAFAYLLRHSPSRLTSVGCVEIILSSVFIAWKLIAARRAHPPVQATASTGEFVRTELAKVKRQAQLLRSVLWWYLLPLFIGTELFDLGWPKSVADKVVLLVVNLVVNLFVFGFIYWLNLRAVRKTLLPLQLELENTLNAAPEFSEPNEPINPKPKNSNKLVKFMKWFIPTFLLVLLISYGAQYYLHAQTPPTDAEFKMLLHERVDTEKEAIGIVVGLLDTNGTRILAYGKTAREHGHDVDGDTVFEIGSITKVFTSLILADMVKHGEVKLDDPISKYLPATVKVPTRNGREITLVDLATHTSGLPRLPDNLAPANEENPYADYTVAQLYEFLASYTLPRDIGSEYEYSNLGGGLLGHVLALRAGTNYEALVLQRICLPLGMTNTSITLSPGQRARLAQGHDEHGRPVPNWDLPTLAGAGGLRSTANDLLKLVAANMGHTKSALQPAMELAQTSRHAADDMQIGLGWHIAKKYGAELVWHNGGTGGYRSFCGFDKKKQRAIVVLVNSENDEDDLGFHWLAGKYELEKSKPGDNHLAIQLDPKILDGLVGRYQLNSTVFINVRHAKDHLQVQMTGQSYLDAYAETASDFFLDAVDAQITFHPAADGKPATLVLHQSGFDQTAKKVSNEVAKPKQHVAIKLDPELYDAYVGRYEFNANVAFTLRRQGDRLMAQLTGQGFNEIFPESETKFFYKVVDAQLSFEKNAKGEITSLTLHQNGIDQKAKKVK